jgi:hypothetical protein
VAVHRFAEAVRVGEPVTLIPELPGGDEFSLTRAWRETGVPGSFAALGTGGARPCLRLGEPQSRWQLQHYGKPEPWTERFARGLIASATDAMERATDARGQTRHRRALGEWDRALAWFTSSFPLLGAMAAASPWSPTPKSSGPGTSPWPRSTPSTARSTSTRTRR